MIPPDVQITSAKDGPYALIQIGDDDIMYIDIKVSYALRLEHVTEIFADSLEVGQGLPYLNLILLNNSSLPSRRAREFGARKERSGRALAEAYVIESQAQRIIGNMYIILNRPVVPTRLFTSTDDARDWLLDLKHQKIEVF